MNLINMVANMKLLLLITLIHSSKGLDTPCQNIILYGDPIWYKAMGVFKLIPELYNGKVQYEDEIKQHFFLRHRDGQWQLIEQVDPSSNVGYAYSNEKFPYDNTNMWTFLDHEWFNYHPNPNFKVECADADPSLWMREGVCVGHAITSAIEKGLAVTTKTCFEACSKIEECAGFSVSKEGCVPLSQICLNPIQPATGGFTYVKGRSNKVLEGRPTQQSTTDLVWSGESSKAIDGGHSGDLVTGKSCTLTLEESAPWWTVHLGQLHVLKAVAVTNSNDCCGERLFGATVAGTTERDPEVILAKLKNSDFSSFEVCGSVEKVIDPASPPNRRHLIRCNSFMLVRSIIIYKNVTDDSDQILSICEVDVFGEQVDKYVYMDSGKVTKDKAEEICSDFLNGTLAHIDSVPSFLSLNSFVTELEITEDVWIGNTDLPSDNGIGEEVYYEEGELIFNAAKVVDGATCTASSSLNGNPCDQALDNNYMTSWAMTEGDTKPWIQITFRFYYKIYKIQLAQRRFSGESFKDVTLEFSEGEKISMPLEHRQGQSESDAAGHMIDVGYVDGLLSNSLKITAETFHSTKNNGFTDIKVLGRPRAGLTFRIGECLNSDVIETMEGEEWYSCDDICLNRLDCNAYIIYKGEDITTRCDLLSSCSAVNTSATVALSVIMENESGYYRHPWDTGCGMGVYVGYRNGLSLQECQEWCENVPECIAMTHNKYLSCELYKKRCSDDDLNWDGNYYLERIGGQRRKANGTYLGCFNDEKVQDLKDNYVKYSSMNIEYCRDHCQEGNYTYFALLGSRECSCDSSYGEYGMTNGERYGHECWTRCFGDSDSVCGGYGSSSVYSVKPHTESCTSIQTYDSMSENYEVLFRKEVCDRELHFICERSNDFCNPDPCKNNGTCSSSDNDYLCVCPPEFEGLACETEVNECLSNPCLNGGICEDLFGGYSCTCDSGFIGVHCEIGINECLSEPCLHGGTCVDSTNGYSCLCEPGYTGKHCEADYNECSSNPCGVFGVCTDAINGYSCVCQAGIYGLNCEVDLDECSSEPCQHNATCRDGINSYICDCGVGFHGDHCQDVDDHCYNRNCSFKGACVNSLTEGVCFCDPGWSGEDCEIDIDDCKTIPCQNDGTCIDGINNSSCLCHPGITGKHCEIYIGNPSTWAEWSDWSECSVSCGSGFSHRTRKCNTTYSKLNPGCNPRDSKETSVCGQSCDNVALNCTIWSPWSECTGSCDEGEQRRTRICKVEEEHVDSQDRKCRPKGCKAAGLACYQCKQEITGYDDITVTCSDTQTCNKRHSHCVYEYGFNEEAYVISTRDSASAEDVMAALHSTNSSCTICCTSPKCNEGFIPVQDVVSGRATSLTHNIIHTTVLLYSVFHVCFVLIMSSKICL